MYNDIIAFHNKLMNDPYWGRVMEESRDRLKEETYIKEDTERIHRNTASIIDMLFMPMSELVKGAK